MCSHTVVPDDGGCPQRQYLPSAPVLHLPGFHISVFFLFVCATRAPSGAVSVPDLATRRHADQHAQFSLAALSARPPRGALFSEELHSTTPLHSSLFLTCGVLLPFHPLPSLSPHISTSHTTDQSHCSQSPSLFFFLFAQCRCCFPRLFFFDSPSHHPFISKKEIKSQQTNKQTKNR
jgi:hypothetical protein